MVMIRQGGKILKINGLVANSTDCCCSPEVVCACSDIPDTVYVHGNQCGAFTITMAEIVTAQPDSRVWRGSGPSPVGEVTYQFACKPSLVDPDALCGLWYCNDGCLGGPGDLCDADVVDPGAGWIFITDIADGTAFSVCATDTAPSFVCDPTCLDPWSHCFSTTNP